jgi:hypothetical protein
LLKRHRMDDKTLTKSDFIRLFKDFSKKDRIAIVREINEEFFNDLWTELDRTLPSLNISESDVRDEIKAVRYDSRKD